MFTWLTDAVMMERIALTLVHFLWQGTLIALLVLLSGTFLARTAIDRHRWSVLGLSLMGASPLIMLAWLTVVSSFEPDRAFRELRSSRSLQVDLDRTPSGAVGSGDLESRSQGVFSEDSHAPSVRGGSMNHAGSPDRGDLMETMGGSSRVATSGLAAEANILDPRSSLDVDGESPDSRFSSTVSAAWAGHLRAQWAQLIVWVWLVGVALFAVRIVIGITAVRWIKRNCQVATNTTCRAVNRLSARMRIQPPRVGVSDRVTQALVTGILRPMIVLPAAWVTQLPPDFLEAVLSHELAHLRRRDLWIIYMQRLIETILFFHPAVWWLSSRLQREREWCCDAFAVRVTGEPVVYVQALEHIARRQREQCMPSLAAGMKGGRKMLLLSRIERVLGVPSSKADSRPAGLFLASLLLAGGFVWLAGSGHPLLAEVGEGTPGEVERKRSGDQEVDTAARAGGDGEKEREPGLAERATDRGERQVSPEEKREFAQQLREQKEHIRELIGDGQLDRARAAEEKLRKHVQEMEERLGNQPFPLQEHVLPRIRQIQQRLQEARHLGQLEEVERLERELEEMKRRARPGADPVRGRLAELQQRMMGAIKGGRPDEVVELGHQIADVLRGSRHDQPARPDDGPFRPRPGAGRPDDRPREARPDGRRPVEGRRPDGPTPPGPARPRPDRPGPAISQELMDVVRQLREEVSQLRREVNELRGERGDERR